MFAMILNYCFYVCIFHIRKLNIMMIFMYYLAKIKDITVNAQTPFVYIIGDFNANISRDTNFGRELKKEFCSVNSLVISDVKLMNSDTITFLSSAHSTTSWLDHCVSTTTGHRIIENVNVSYDYISSDHFPMTIIINCRVRDFKYTCVQADSEFSFINRKTATGI